MFIINMTEFVEEMLLKCFFRLAFHLKLFFLLFKNTKSDKSNKLVQFLRFIGQVDIYNELY